MVHKLSLRLEHPEVEKRAPQDSNIVKLRM
jgi:hypothetical protein